ncbi:MAG: ATP-binding cassette domain-containing protein [Longimicrobiales bacterium]|nr:ATP-binding cassette domain-containing protein [Longimicrobiales bacterium]
MRGPDSIRTPESGPPPDTRARQRGGLVPGAPGLQAHLVVRRSDSFVLDVELSIPAGRTVVLLGPNGAGKSTAVGALAGLIPLDAGRVELGGEVLDDPGRGVWVPPEERRVGVVFQDYLLFPHLTALENVAFGLRSRARADARDHAREWMERLDLTGLEGRRPRDLSGGQAQRVALARALASDPRLLLLDEPLSALDVTTRGRLRRILSTHLQSFPGPRLMITHDPTEAFLLADEIHVIEEGRVTQTGTADDIRLRPRTAYAADLAGTNLLTGTAGGGEVETEGHVLHIADEGADGPVLVTIRPAAVSVHRHRPEGSQRNAWPTTLEQVEPLGGRVRLLTGDPLPLTVEVTRESKEELELVEGSRVWVAVKATEIAVQPDASAQGSTEPENGPSISGKVRDRQRDPGPLGGR